MIDNLSPVIAQHIAAVNAFDSDAIVATFAPDAYVISAGETYTLTMTNQGEAIHNWHILDVRREGGKSIETPLTAPHKSSRTTFAIPRAGTYHFQCDVHPDTMKGTLTVR